MKNEKKKVVSFYENIYPTPRESALYVYINGLFSFSYPLDNVADEKGWSDNVFDNVIHMDDFINELKKHIKFSE